MTNDKMNITKNCADHIKSKIKEIYVKKENFAQWENIDMNELAVGLKDKKISARLMCCIYEKLQLQRFEDGRIIDSMNTLRKLVKEAVKDDPCFEDKVTYDYETIMREITGKRVSKPLGKNLNRELSINIDSDLPLSIKYAALGFGNEETNEELFIILKSIMKKLPIEQLKYLSENMGTFCLMNRSDWEFLYLIQNLDTRNLEKAEEFIEEHTLHDESSTKSLQFLKMVDKKPSEGIKKKNEYMIDIKRQLSEFHQKPGMKFITLSLLIRVIPYIFYMTEMDWRMLSKFSLLEGGKSKSDYFKRQKWAITYVRGLVYTKNQEPLF